MPKVTVLNCPSCGAPLPTDSSRCDFCKARVEISEDRTTVIFAGMVCTKCGWDNAASRFFCGKCGTNLIQKCPNCSGSNPMGLRYCGDCGLETGEARRLALDKRRREAEQNGWRNPPAAGERLYHLYRDIAEPGEELIIFRRTIDQPTTLHVDEPGETRKTAFAVTDRGFMFLEPESGGFLAADQPAIAKKIPFEEVTSLTVDLPKAELVISFEGGVGRTALSIEKDQKMLRNHSAWSTVCRSAAGGMIYYFKPFLPLRLQREW